MIILKKQSMVTTIKKYANQRQGRSGRMIGFFLFCMTFYFYSFAQAGSGEKKEVTVDLTVSQVNAGLIELKAIAQVKWDSVFDVLKGHKVSFFAVTDSAETLLGIVETDFDGVAVLSVQSGKIIPKVDGTLSFSASTEGTDKLSEGKGELSTKRAIISFKSFEGDSVHSVTVKVVSVVEGVEIPVKEAEVGVFIKRLFSNYPIGEAVTTDENGEVSVEIPGGLSGDEKGNYTLVAKVDETEEFGTLEARVLKPWGIKKKVDALRQRTLWSHAPPLWMLITFIVLISVVWGHYMVIIYKLMRLKHQ
jgi:hypothetical protein